jgi:hypothetical protein
VCAHVLVHTVRTESTLTCSVSAWSVLMYVCVLRVCATRVCYACVLCVCATRVCVSVLVHVSGHGCGVGVGVGGRLHKNRLQANYWERVFYMGYTMIGCKQSIF